MIFKNVTLLISLCIVLIAGSFPFNYIIGSHGAWFSCLSMVLPALGYHYSLVYVILYFLTKGLLTFSLLPLFFLHRLPLFFAAVALRHWNFYTAIIFPLCAITLFCVHPLGYQVFYYALYWFIPIFLYIFCADTVYYRAITASLIAHATGSVVWLYYGAIPVELWTAVVPIVPIERLFIALGMLACIFILRAIDSMCKDKVAA